MKVFRLLLPIGLYKIPMTIQCESRELIVDTINSNTDYTVIEFDNNIYYVNGEFKVKLIVEEYNDVVIEDKWKETIVVGEMSGYIEEEIINYNSAVDVNGRRWLHQPNWGTVEVEKKNER